MIMMSREERRGERSIISSSLLLLQLPVVICLDRYWTAGQEIAAKASQILLIFKCILKNDPGLEMR